MAAKKPIIGTRSGAIPEIIEDRKSGLLVNPCSSKEIQKGIIELISDDNFAKSLSESAYRTVCKMTLDREAAVWINVYNYVLKGKKC